MIRLTQKDKPTLAEAMTVKSQKFANGGQVGLDARKERLRGMLFKQSEPAQEEPMESLDDLFTDELPPEPEVSPEIKRKERLLGIISQNRLKSFRK